MEGLATLIMFLIVGSTLAIFEGKRRAKEDIEKYKSGKW